MTIDATRYAFEEREHVQPKCTVELAHGILGTHVILNAAASKNIVMISMLEDGLCQYEAEGVQNQYQESQCPPQIRQGNHNAVYHEGEVVEPEIRPRAAGNTKYEAAATRRAMRVDLERRTAEDNVVLERCRRALVHPGGHQATGRVATRQSCSNGPSFSNTAEGPTSAHPRRQARTAAPWRGGAEQRPRAENRQAERPRPPSPPRPSGAITSQRGGCRHAALAADGQYGLVIDVNRGT